MGHAASKSDLFQLIADSAPVLIWMSNPDKLCTYFNRTWLDFTGRSLEQELGNGWLEGVHPDDKERCMKTYIESFDLREKFRMEYRLLRSDGDYRWLLDIGVPRFDASQMFAGYIGIGVDVTDRKHTEQELERINERLQLSMDAGRIGGWESDLETGERFWFGRTHELMDMHSRQTPSSEEAWSRVHPDDRARLQIALDNAKVHRTSFEEEFRVTHTDGSVRWLRSQGRYFYAANGEAKRVLGVSVDVTGLKQVEEKLLEREHRLHLALRAGKMYAYEWDVLTDRMFRSGESSGILGYEPPLTRQGILPMVHPEDRNLFIEMAQRTPDSPDAQAIYRILRPDGSIAWLENTGHAFFDESGRMLRMLGMIADVTERKLAEQSLADTTRRLTEIQEDERRRIARELHDDINQRLAVLAIEAQILKNESENSSPAFAGRLNDLFNNINDIARAVQSISHQLHSAQLEYLGIVAAIRALCREFGQRQPIEIAFTHDNIPERIPHDISLCLFRIVQEALNNAVKYSNARECEIKLVFLENQLQLTVSDRGSGFDTDTAAHKGGLGLVSMRERVRMVNGTIFIDSKPMKGTTIRVQIPWEPKKPSVAIGKEDKKAG
jgi:PAS domain S-box-containing protein